MGSEDAARTVDRRCQARPAGATRLPTSAMRVALGLIAAIGLFSASEAFASDRVVGDFDGDGLRDHVAISHGDPRVLRVWLSSTHRIDVIHSPEPILHIAAADLDGDRRPELVARVSSKLRVWMRRNGRFHAYRPQHRSTLARLSRARNHASNADPLCAELSTTELVSPSLESSVLTTVHSVAVWIDPSNPVRGPTADAPVHPFLPRPPPDFHTGIVFRS
jgi:hypothetical protein